MAAITKRHRESIEELYFLRPKVSHSEFYFLKVPSFTIFNQNSQSEFESSTSSHAFGGCCIMCKEKSSVHFVLLKLFPLFPWKNNSRHKVHKSWYTKWYVKYWTGQQLNEQTGSDPDQSNVQSIDWSRIK